MDFQVRVSLRAHVIIIINVEVLYDRYFEDLFAKDAGLPTIVNVASKAYRAVSLKPSCSHVSTLKAFGIGMVRTSSRLTR